MTTTVRLVPALAITCDSGGRRSPPGTTRRPVMCPGTLAVTVRSQPAPATTSDRTYLREPVLALAISLMRDDGTSWRPETAVIALGRPAPVADGPLNVPVTPASALQ